MAINLIKSGSKPRIIIKTNNNKNHHSLDDHEWSEGGEGHLYFSIYLFSSAPFYFHYTWCKGGKKPFYPFQPA